MRKPTPEAADPAETVALEQAVRGLLEPLARLAVARGVPFAALEQALKQACVDAASQAHGGAAQAHRQVSRIASATGLSRREVARLTQPEAMARPPAPPRTRASELFARWMSDPVYRTRRGPRTLPRLGPAPSFESLAQAVTREVHPRGLLDEMLRLNLASHDLERDTVALAQPAFVPRGDAARMLGFLGANVGDHLSAAVDNVLADGGRHVEQALFADGLPENDLPRVRELVAAQWPVLRAALVPELTRMLDAAQAAGTPGTRRVRVGLYGYDDGAAAAPDTAPPRPRRIRPLEK